MMRIVFFMTLMGALCVNLHAENFSESVAYAHGLLNKAGVDGVEFREVKGLGDDEAFRVARRDDRFVVEHQASAGALYGALALIGEGM